MAEGRPSWLTSGRQSGGYGPVLKINAGENFTIRLLDQQPPEWIWKHSCRTPDGKFVKVLCTNTWDDKTKCPLCRANNFEKHRELKNRDKPYPISSEYAQPVYVYEEKAVKLLVGSDVWQRIDLVFQQGADIFGFDLSVTRNDDSGRTVYNVLPVGSAKPFTETVDPDKIPKIVDYKQFLADNVKRVAVITSENDPTPQPPAETAAQPRSMLSGAPLQTPPPAAAPASAAPANPPAAAAPAAAGGPSPARQETMKKFQKVLGKTSFNSGIMLKVLGTINTDRKAANPQAATTSDVESLTDAEFSTFVDRYEKEAQVQ